MKHRLAQMGGRGMENSLDSLDLFTKLDRTCTRRICVSSVFHLWLTSSSAASHANVCVGALDTGQPARCNNGTGADRNRLPRVLSVRIFRLIAGEADVSSSRWTAVQGPRSKVQGQ